MNMGQGRIALSVENPFVAGENKIAGDFHYKNNWLGAAKYYGQLRKLFIQQIY